MSGGAQHRQCCTMGHEALHGYPEKEQPRHRAGQWGSALKRVQGVSNAEGLWEGIAGEGDGRYKSLGRDVPAT